MEQAENLAYAKFYTESNSVWSRAAEIAVKLLKDNPPASFLDEEYNFLKTIVNHITEEE